MLTFSDACERNKEPILQVLREQFAQRMQILEIGSGTGQHAVYFSAHLPHLMWYPTEQLNYLSDLAWRIKDEGPINLRPPTVLDVCQPVWPLQSVDAMFTANTLHIMSWSAVESLFQGVGRTLTPGGVLCIYGPFRYDGKYTSPSNREFDLLLKSRDAQSGIREMQAINALAASVGLTMSSDYDLPAHNRLLVFNKEI